MAVPSSGSLSMQDIACEKVFDNYNHPTDGIGASQRAGIGAISLADVSTSGNSNGSGTSFDATNTNSSSYPNGTTPHSMSEFYDYDHDASSTSSGTLYYSSSGCGSDGFDVCLFGTPGTYYWSGSGNPVTNGYAIFTNSALTSTAPAGCYSDAGSYRLWVTFPSPAWSGSANGCPQV